ncbi:MAG: leucyl aminopeptidase [Chloroflexi bacterium]|nr:MAG: leucyl aminopeptidase [Chloroflexota bacterium]
MQLDVKHGRIQDEPADLIVVNLLEGVMLPGGATGALDSTLKGMIGDVLASGDFKGKPNSTLVFYPRGLIAAKRVLLVGLGKADKFGIDQARQAAATAAKKARELGAHNFATIVHGAGIGMLPVRDAAQALAEGTLLGLYRFDEFKRADESVHAVESVSVVEADPAKLDDVKEGVRTGQIIAEGQILARDLSNKPGNAATPSFLADVARSIGERYQMQVDVLGLEQARAMGMGLFAGVAQGSNEPARFIVMDYNAGKEGVGTLVLIGKGITFDSGGLSIKPTEGMWDMKHDMSGGAAVLGAMQAVGALQLPLHVVGIVPATENLPSSKAFKPGDILRALNGKTVEIHSTDAEGRLVLGDALCYASRYQPQGVIDMATLTGACVVALGKHAAGLLSNDDALAEKVKAAGQKTGERVWQLPLWDDYAEQIKSTFADMKNTGGRPAGAITAAAIMKNFVDYPWVHLDIAGTAWGDDDKGYNTKGASGFGVRLCVEVLRSWQ